MTPLIQLKLRRSRAPLSLDDYERRARGALPGMVWAFVSGGADDLKTRDANRSAFDRWALRARVLTGNPDKELGVTIAGQQLDLPVLLAPTGLIGIVQWEGELGAATAAERAGTRAVISTMSTYSPEEIAAGTGQAHFFQLYPWAKGTADARAQSRNFLDRVARSGYEALFVTVDVPVVGNREGEQRYGMGIPPVLSPAGVLSAAIRPKWWFNLFRHQRVSARLLVDEGGLRAATESVEEQIRFTTSELDWEDFAWMRAHWDKPLFIKGILDPDDAERAVSLGADGVVVSNHGGRQLDGAQATLDALPAIVDRVGGRVPVLLDGGVRRGSDVVKALCLGASAVLIGRPFVYGLAVNGSQGVQHVLEILRSEIFRTLSLMGVRSVAELDRSWLIPVAAPAAPGTVAPSAVAGAEEPAALTPHV
jgi:L-lactate dehydrogenase (cytochrome)/(S)-mandelate dehydrogenase